MHRAGRIGCMARVSAWRVACTATPSSCGVPVCFARPFSAVRTAVETRRAQLAASLTGEDSSVEAQLERLWKFRGYVMDAPEGASVRGSMRQSPVCVFAAHELCAVV